MEKIVIVDEYIIKLDVCDLTNVSRCKPNTINGYNKQGKLIWTISELLENYSNVKSSNYIEDIFFDVIDLGKKRVKCIGFYNHLEIDLDKLVITRLINNK